MTRSTYRVLTGLKTWNRDILLEALAGDRKGQHSIRVNQQWRVCFRWVEGHAYDVEFCDYH